MKCRSIKFIIGCLVSISLFLSGCAVKPSKTTHTDTGMGTIIQETLYVTDDSNEAAAEIMELLRELENDTLSWRLETSEVYQINVSAGSQKGYQISSQMQSYLETLKQVHEASGGALDVTVGPITQLWKLDEWAVADASARENFTVPASEQITEALAHVGYEKVLLQEDTVYLPEGMKLDLGAVGKGIACDIVGEYLNTQENISGATVSVGGSIVTYGSKPDGSNWNIAIMHPREENSLLGTLSLQGEWYISTSGDYERYVEKDGIRYHHIMDPDSGYPVDNEVCSITIVSDSGLLSDALSTACFVLGVEEGLKLAEKYGAEALFFTKNLHVYQTKGMESMFRELSN